MRKSDRYFVDKKGRLVSIGFMGVPVKFVVGVNARREKVSNEYGYFNFIFKLGEL